MNNFTYEDLPDNIRKDLVVHVISEILSAIDESIKAKEFICFYTTDEYLLDEECDFIKQFLIENLSNCNVAYTDTPKHIEDMVKIHKSFVVTIDILDGDETREYVDVCYRNNEI